MGPLPCLGLRYWGDRGYWEYLYDGAPWVLLDWPAGWRWGDACPARTRRPKGQALLPSLAHICLRIGILIRKIEPGYVSITRRGIRHLRGFACRDSPLPPPSDKID